jgi:hypothetical protein
VSHVVERPAPAPDRTTDERSSSTFRVERIELPDATREAIKNNLRIGKNAVKLKILAAKGKGWKTR